MLAGMLVVYVFLSALLVMIKVSAHFFGSPPQSAEDVRPPSNAPVKGGEGAMAAVISTALSTYKSRKG